MPHTAIREAVAVFHDEKSLQSAIDDLLSHGFDRADISVLAQASAVESKLGHHYTSVKELEDDAEIPAVSYVSAESRGDAEGGLIGGFLYVGAVAGYVPVVATGGTLAAALTGMALVGGGALAIGVALARLIEKHHADYIEEQLQHGGLLLWVRTWHKADEKRAVKILSRHSAEDVHVHSLSDAHKDIEQEQQKEDAGVVFGDNVIPFKNKTFYTKGRLFSCDTSAQAFLNRTQAIEIFFKDMERHGINSEQALKSPESVFKTPEGLLQTELSRLTKVELLKRWAFDKKRNDSATNEGMPPSSKSGVADVTLQDVMDALNQIDA